MNKKYLIMNKILFTMLVSLFSTNIYAQSSDINDYLFPQPKKVEIKSGYLNNVYGLKISNNNFLSKISNIIDVNVTGKIMHIEYPFVMNTYSFSIDDNIKNKQAYEIIIDTCNITIKAASDEALFYGKQTLKQIIAYHNITKEDIPCMVINDEPDFKKRGFMLDISRNKVPTMESLFSLVDILASFKINEFQLYTEHTFAYKNHKEVWKDASPMTPKQIKFLETYCKSKFIDLVPNQNSFGHMENWLNNEKYLPLAECPDYCKTIWGKRRRHTLDPQNPGSFALVKELYAELLPNFSSKYFNIGCDETVELGVGKSKKICKKRGKGVVYLDFVKKLNDEVNKHGKIAMFWGDIIIKHPELLDRVPKNMIALEWGYSSEFPFNERLPKYKKAGLDFYVCPGTSSWNSIIGRNQTGFKNQKIAAKEGLKNGALGYLNTSWGDRGYWQPLSVTMPTIITGSAYAWNSNSNPLNNLSNILNAYVYKDETGNTAKAILDLGFADTAFDVPEGNSNVIMMLMTQLNSKLTDNFQLKKLTSKDLIKAEQNIDNAIDELKKAKPQSYDADIVKKELLQAANMAKFACHLGLARLNAKNTLISNIHRNKREELAEELEPLIKNHETIWTVRNREGGLELSANRYKKLLDKLKGKND